MSILILKKSKKREVLSNSRMPANNCRMSDKIRKITVLQPSTY